MAQRILVLLGGGGAKAAAHLGVARALKEAGMAPMHWAGTSMGGVIAAALATGDDPAAILTRFAAFRPKDVLVRDTLALLRGIWAKALVKPDPFRRGLGQLIQSRAFAELRTPCTVTAVEIETGREVAFGSGGEDAPLMDVLAAACALPPYFAPVMVNGRRCFDGGTRGVLPLRWAENVNCDLVIAVDTGPGFDETGPPVIPPPPLIAGSDAAIGWLMAGTTELLRAQWVARPGAPQLIWLRPTHDRGATFATDRIPGYADAGYRAMQVALKELS